MRFLKRHHCLHCGAKLSLFLGRNEPRFCSGEHGEAYRAAIVARANGFEVKSNKREAAFEGGEGERKVEFKIEPDVA